jgi:tRNA-Thr(GGU) m(6)t(6)A37 methyltransferase TsaA
MSNSIRPGEIRAPTDPSSEEAGDARLVFIGRARTPWTSKETCPKNLREARERGAVASVEIGPDWRAGLRDLSPGDAVILLTWLDRARRDLVVQAPRHRATTSGVFSIRSPVRPNPIGLHVVRIVSLDLASGVIEVDALDCLDKTPVLDLKPWRAGVDVPAGTSVED